MSVIIEVACMVSSYPFLVVMIATKVSHLVWNWNHSSLWPPTDEVVLFNVSKLSVFLQHGRTKTVASHFISSFISSFEATVFFRAYADKGREWLITYNSYSVTLHPGLAPFATWVYRLIYFCIYLGTYICYSFLHLIIFLI